MDRVMANDFDPEEEEDEEDEEREEHPCACGYCTCADTVETEGDVCANCRQHAHQG